MTPSDVSIAELMIWIAAGSSLLGFGTTVWNLLSSGSRQNKTRITALDEKLNRHIDETKDRFARQEQRIASTAEALGALPGREDVHQLHLKLTEMSGDLKAMQATNEGTQKILGRLEAIVSRHEDHLLSGARK